MGEARRNLLSNLTGALAVGLVVGYVMSVRIGGPPFRELFAPNFLRVFVPYLLATLLAYRFTPRAVADYVFIPLVGSALSLSLFYHRVAGFVLPPPEFVPVLLLFFAAYLAVFAGFGFAALVALRAVVSAFVKSSYR